jgi:hypothetical protein
MGKELPTPAGASSLAYAAAIAEALAAELKGSHRAIKTTVIRTVEAQLSDTAVQRAILQALPIVAARDDMTIHAPAFGHRLALGDILSAGERGQYEKQ